MFVRHWSLIGNTDRGRFVRCSASDEPLERLIDGRARTKVEKINGRPDARWLV